MKLSLITVLLTLLALSSAADGRLGEVLCQDRETLRQRLQAQYGAQLIGFGLREPEVLLEIWAMPDNGDWTLVQSYATGSACILAIGESWENLTPGPETH